MRALWHYHFSGWLLVACWLNVTLCGGLLGALWFGLSFLMDRQLALLVALLLVAPITTYTTMLICRRHYARRDAEAHIAEMRADREAQQERVRASLARRPRGM